MSTGKVCDNSVEINGTGNSLEPLNVDAKNIPDLVPVCAALACYAKGTSKISGAQRLKLKESDRLKSLYLELEKDGRKNKGRCRQLNRRRPLCLAWRSN